MSNRIPYTSNEEKDVLSSGSQPFKLAELILKDLDKVPSDRRVAVLKNRLSWLLAEGTIDGWGVDSHHEKFSITLSQPGGAGGIFIFSFASKVDTVYKERRKELDKQLGATEKERRSDKWPLS